MQPTFLPWIGYFNLMSNVDVFVFLDDVQLQRRSWQMRNRVLSGGSEVLISLPLHSAPRDTHICDVVPAIDKNWISKVFKTLEQAYSRAPFGIETIEMLGIELRQPAEDLAELNIRVIKRISKLIGLNVKTCRSSEIDHSGHRSDHLLSLCKSLNCNTYVSPVGSREYLETDGVFRKSSVELLYNDYTPVEYPQISTSSFVPYLSIIDLLANVGPLEALNYVRNER